MRSSVVCIVCAVLQESHDCYYFFTRVVGWGELDSMADSAKEKIIMYRQEKKVKRERTRTEEREEIE